MRKNEEPPLTSSEIEAFQEKLLQLRKELLGDLNHIRGETLNNNSRGELSNMPVHMADIGTDNYEQEFALGLMDSERILLEEIDRSLENISKGCYGICEGTGKLIGRARLEAKPYARYCVDFQEKLEKGLVKPPSDDDDDDDDD